MWRFVVQIACAVLIACQTPAFASADGGKRLAQAIEAMRADDWPTARRIVAQIPDDAAKIYADWRRLRAGDASWSEYPRFLAAHGDWPGLPLLRKVGEARIPVGRPAREILAYFQNDVPQTGTGALRLAAAYESVGQTENAHNAAILAWRTLDLAQSEREALAARYGKVLAPHHWARADHLIWEGEYNQALAMTRYLSAGQRKLVEARVALRRGQNGVTKMIDAVPAALRKDPGLAYDRFRWRLRKDLWDGAEELMLASSASAKTLGRPEAWAGRRASMTRRAMRAQSYSKAYRLAANHNLAPGASGYTDLEWLSGYLKLIYLGEPAKAVEHFRNLRSVAVTPITQGRVWYWLGRAHEANGNGEKATEAYTVAARFPTSFYGQMAIDRSGVSSTVDLGDLRKADWRSADFRASSVFKAGTLLHHAGERYEGGRFFAHMAETMSQSDQSKLGQYLLEIDRPNMALRVAKNAAKLGRININSYYPVTELADLAQTVPPELVMAIARQETELNPEAISGAGARGLMQTMPATAKAMAKKIGVPYSRDRLTTDWKYNARLGIAYLREMLDRYNGSYVLAAAAYNAGPHRADRWIREYGDPRSPRTNTEQWIEKIPFNETRNYVHRVLESVNVYRARLTGTVAQMDIARDLKRGG